MRFKNYIRIFGFVVILIIGVVSQNNYAIAQKKPNLASRIWSVGSKKGVKIVKLTVEGALAFYASYIAFKWAVNSISDVKGAVTWRKPIMPILNRLLYNGCIIAGLGTLVAISGNACLEDMESL